jgi:hypothetical protein
MDIVEEAEGLFTRLTGAANARLSSGISILALQLGPQRAESLREEIALTSDLEYPGNLSVLRGRKCGAEVHVQRGAGTGCRPRTRRRSTTKTLLAAASDASQPLGNVALDANGEMRASCHLRRANGSWGCRGSRSMRPGEPAGSPSQEHPFYSGPSISITGGRPIDFSPHAENRSVCAAIGGSDNAEAGPAAIEERVRTLM